MINVNILCQSRERMDINKPFFLDAICESFLYRNYDITDIYCRITLIFTLFLKYMKC